MRYYLLLFFIFPGYLTAQISSFNSPPLSTVSKKEHASPLSLSLQAFYQRGVVLQTNTFVSGANIEREKIDHFHAFSIRLSHQTNGSRDWERRFLNPRYGLGIYLADFFEVEQIGLPLAIYGFFAAPFRRGKRLIFNYEFGFGFTFNWRSFDPITNQYNIALGAGRSFIIDAGANLSYALSPQLNIELGASLTHFSNGGIKQPNFGINTFAPKLLLSHHITAIQPRPKLAETSIHLPSNEYLLTFFGGSKNLIYDTISVELAEKWEGVNFPVFGINAVYHRHLTYKTKLGFGLGFSYDGSLAAQITIDEGELEPIPTSFINKLQLSAFLSYELSINHLAILLEPSFYVYRKKTVNQSPIFHQRIGVKYYFFDHLSLGITLRSYQFRVSDFVEWSTTYRF